jgi:hypothetical protein
MNRQYGYAAYAALGALIGGVLPYGYQVADDFGPLRIAACVVVGALFGAALRDRHISIFCDD